MNQEHIAVTLIAVFRSVWCERNDTKHTEFNCKRCAFGRDDGLCLAKIFIKEHSEPMIDMPQGVIAEPCVEGVKE